MIISIKLYLILRLNMDLWLFVIAVLASPFWRQDVLAPSRFGANFYFLETNYYYYLTSLPHPPHDPWICVLLRWYQQRYCKFNRVYNTPKIPDMQTVFHKISQWINIILRNITSMLIFRYSYWKKYLSIKLWEIIFVLYATLKPPWTLFPKQFA